MPASSAFFICIQICQGSVLRKFVASSEGTYLRRTSVVNGSRWLKFESLKLKACFLAFPIPPPAVTCQPHCPSSSASPETIAGKSSPLTKTAPACGVDPETCHVTHKREKFHTDIRKIEPRFNVLLQAKPRHPRQRQDAGTFYPAMNPSISVSHASIWQRRLRSAMVDHDGKRRT